MKLNAVNIFNNLILTFRQHRVYIHSLFAVTCGILLISCNSGVGGIANQTTINTATNQYYQVPVIFQCVSGCNNLFSENNPLHITVTSQLSYVYINRISESEVKTVYTESEPYAPVYYILYNKNMATFLNNNPNLVVAQIHYKDMFGDEKYIPLTISNAISQYGANATTDSNNWSGNSPNMSLSAGVSGAKLQLDNSLMVPGGTYLNSCQFIGYDANTGVVSASCGESMEVSSINSQIICSSMDNDIINLNGVLACEKYSSSNVLSIAGLSDILGSTTGKCTVSKFIQNDETDVTTMTGFCFNNASIPIAYNFAFQSTSGDTQYGSPCNVGYSLNVLDSEGTAPYLACVSN